MEQSNSQVAWINGGETYFLWQISELSTAEFSALDPAMNIVLDSLSLQDSQSGYSLSINLIINITLVMRTMSDIVSIASSNWHRCATMQGSLGHSILLALGTCDITLNQSSAIEDEWLLVSWLRIWMIFGACWILEVYLSNTCRKSGTSIRNDMNHLIWCWNRSIDL